LTEAEWLASDDPTLMLDFLGPSFSDRVVRLFACACGRLAWHLMTDERSRRAIELNECFAERQVTVEERSACLFQANAASLQARRKLAYPEEAATQAFATAAEAAELIFFPPGNWPLLKCGVDPPRPRWHTR
jgi:lauroyl/myristoyl acyltransferase